MSRADVDDELAFHLEMRRRDLEARGLADELHETRPNADSAMSPPCATPASRSMNADSVEQTEPR